jgi:carboxymethylenebutenolidase
MNLFQRYLVEEFAEDYQDGLLSKKDALHFIASICGSEQKAVSYLDSMKSQHHSPGGPVKAGLPPIPYRKPTLPEDTDTLFANQERRASPDTPIQASELQFPGKETSLLGYLARPTEEGRYPVILVCHENRGLTEHIKDVARRLAGSGFIAMAVDLLSRQGGTAVLEASEIPAILGNTDPDQFVQDFLSAWDYLQQQPNTIADQVGMTGFCFGGGVTWRVATRMPQLKAAVPFYGPHPPVEDVPDIRASILAVYAGGDQRINQGIPVIEEAMQRLHKPFAKIIYPDTEHAFFNDTGPRYNPESARDAWIRTLAWFEKHLERE